VELKAASWLSIGDSSPTDHAGHAMSSIPPAEPINSMQNAANVIEYSDDEDDVEYTDANSEIV